MKTKNCGLCNKEESVLYRIQIDEGKRWIFVCTTCCNAEKTKAHYHYGGTWKGSRH